MILTQANLVSLSGVHSDRLIRNLMEIDHLRSAGSRLEARFMGLPGFESTLCSGRIPGARSAGSGLERSVRRARSIRGRRDAPMQGTKGTPAHGLYALPSRAPARSLAPGLPAGSFARPGPYERCQLPGLTMQIPDALSIPDSLELPARMRHRASVSRCLESGPGGASDSR